MLIFVLGLPGCSSGKKLVRKKVTLITTKKSDAPAFTHTPPPITVWIHGSRLAQPLDAPIHAAPKHGLHHISKIPKRFRVKGIVQTISEADPKKFPLEGFYIFGWSGYFKFTTRLEAARELYTSLQQVVAQTVKKYNKIPEIRIITHSHGGSIALNLAKFKDPTDAFKITDLILLAAPVQYQTSGYVKDPLFEKIYSLYSSMDWLQRIDPQGLYEGFAQKGKPIFSERTFPIDPKLRQAKLKINGHGLDHLAFFTKSFVKLIPSIMDWLDDWEAEHPSVAEEERLLSIKRGWFTV